jgi:hypothetical protein
MKHPSDKTRKGIYLTGIVSFVGIALAGVGIAEFDLETGVIDLAPFNAYALVATAPSIIALVMAPIALIRQWSDDQRQAEEKEEQR